MNFKKILVLVMTFAMLLGTFAPTLGVFATELNNDEHNHDEKDPLIYVSIGDSMTNGYGLPGYDGVSGIVNYGTDVYSNQFAAWLAGYTGEIKDDQVIFEGTNGIVDHRQLAMSGLLAEDLHWMLELDYKNQAVIDGVQHLWDAHSWGDGCHHGWYATSEDDRNTICPDGLNGNCNFCGKNKCCPALGFTSGFYRTYGDLCAPDFRMADGAARILATYMHEQGNGYGYFTSTQVGSANIDAIYNGIKANPEYPTGDHYGEMGGKYHFLQIAAEFYQESVKDADIISLALGNTNFGTLMFDFIQDAIANPNDTGFTRRYFFSDIYDYMMDPTVYTPELKAEIEKLMGQVDAMIEANFDAEMFEGLETIKYIVKYCTLSYIVNYIAVVNNILKVNPDVELIQVALMNAYAGASAGTDDGSLAMADMIDMLYNPLNAFIAAVPSLLKNGGQYPESKFYYADCGTVETLTDVFGDDYYSYDGEVITYSEYVELVNSADFDATKLTHNDASVIRSRFAHWIAGESPYGGHQYLSDAYLQIEFVDHPYADNWGWLDVTSYGELWKYLLGPAECSWTTMEEYNQYIGGQLQREKIFGKYRGVVINYSDIREFELLSNEEKWARLNSADEYVMNKAFSCAMYACFENAIIRAGQQQFTMDTLSNFSGFNEHAFKGALELFAEKMGVESVRSNIEINSLEEFANVLKVFSDALVEDPKSAVIMCLANRMEIGSGIGGHPSQGGHDHMFEAVLATYENEYTSEDKLAELVGKTGLERVYFALLNCGYLTMTQTLEIVNALSERFDLANLGELELTQDDIIYVIDYIYNYLLEHNVEADARIDIIKTVYANLKGDLLADFSPALDTLGAIYSRLNELEMLSNEAAFNIVDFVYDKIIDFKVDDQDVYQIATYIYKTLFFTKATPVFFRLARSPFDQFEDYTVELPVDQKIEIINIVFDELKNSAYVEETPELAPVVELYEELKADENVGEEAIALIVDMAFESISERTLNDEEVDTEELVAEVTEKILTTDELDITAKATIANKVVETIKNSTLPGGSSTVVVPEIPDLTKVANILNVLKNKGYIDESDINTVLTEVMDLLVKGEFSVDTGIELVKLVYDLVLADLSLEEKGEFVTVLYDAVKEEYDLTDEEVAQIAVELVLEYYDEAYLYGYDYLDQNSYIDVAVDGIKVAIDAIYVAIDEVNGGLLGTTDELTEKLVKELYETIFTLEELINVLANDSAKDVEGLVAAVLELEDDLYRHLGNIYEILAQAGIDVNELVIIPALKDALEYIETVVIPQARETVAEFTRLVIEYVQAKVEYYFGIVCNYIIEVLVKIQLHVDEKLTNAVAPLVPVFTELFNKFMEIYGNVEDALRYANLVFEKLLILNEKYGNLVGKAVEQVMNLYYTLIDIYGSVEGALVALNDILMNVVDTVVKVGGNLETAIENAIELYNTILEVLKNTYGTVQNIVTVASQIFARVYAFAGEDLQVIFNDIVTIVKNASGDIKNAYAVASQIYAYLVDTFDMTFDGKYVVDEDSIYVSLGDAEYGEELAEMLKLQDKYFNFSLDEDYLATIALADLITVRFDNGEAIGFVLTQLYMPEELDWSKYLDAEGVAALENVLADIKAELINSGAAAEMVAMLSAVMEENFELTGAEITEAMVADVMVAIIEGTLYTYAEFIDRTIVTLENVYATAPEALVVITGIQNPIADLNLSEFGLDFEFGEYAKVVDGIVKALNAHLIFFGSTNENTIFVDSVDAEDIFNALNVEFATNGGGEEPPVVCEHEYDDCEDTTCNKCGEERTAPSHSFTNYVYNNDATCGVNGTETAKCDNCDAENTREAQGTALQHKYGEWVVVKEATTEATGLKERTCEHCGHKETEVIPMILPESTNDAPEKKNNNTAYIVIAVVVVLLGVCIFVKKPAGKKATIQKEEVKEENETSEEK